MGDFGHVFSELSSISREDVQRHLEGGSSAMDVVVLRPVGLGVTNFWFDHSTPCNKLCVVGVS